MTSLEYLSLVLLFPVSGLLIGAFMMWVVARDAAREDRKTQAGE